MDVTVKEKILLGVLLLIVLISPVFIYLGSQSSNRDAVDLNLPVAPIVEVEKGQPTAPVLLDQIISQAGEYTAAGEYAKSLDLLDGANLKISARKDARIKDVYLTTYDRYSADLIRQGDYAEAIRILQNKIDVDPGHADEINSKILDTYFLRIDRDKSKHFFKQALDTLKNTLPAYKKYDTGNRIQKEKKIILSALSKDTGVDGRNAVEDTIEDVCSNLVVTEADYLPYLGSDKNHQKFVECKYRMDLDIDQTPKTLSEFKYFVYIFEKENYLDPCGTSDSAQFEHIQVVWSVSVIDILTRKSIFQKDFPAQITACPASLKDNQDCDQHIDRPRKADVLEYLQTVLK